MPLVTFDQDDQLGEIVIDNPPLNLFSGDLLSDLGSAVEQAAHSKIRPCWCEPLAATSPQEPTPRSSQG